MADGQGRTGSDLLEIGTISKCLITFIGRMVSKTKFRDVVVGVFRVSVEDGRREASNFRKAISTLMGLHDVTSVTSVRVLPTDYNNISTVCLSVVHSFVRRCCLTSVLKKVAEVEYLW